MSIIQVNNLSKRYSNGFTALNAVNLTIEEGEIFALLGPNGAGKTTLISSICGLVQPTSGTIRVMGYDTVSQYKQARQQIGLVPQELTLGAFDKVRHSVAFNRGLFGLAPDEAYIDNVLKRLSLDDKADSLVMMLSGGMKRRVLIAKALSHNPNILFLDEPTAGVDVELRKGMWEQVKKLRDAGVTIILTSHYIEEVELMADRVGVINSGELVLVEEKHKLMNQLGTEKLCIHLEQTIESVPEIFKKLDCHLSEDKKTLHISYNKAAYPTLIKDALSELAAAGLELKDLSIERASLEDIFINLVK